MRALLKRQKRRLASIASVLGLAVVAPACIFFVPGSGPLETTECHFQSETSACGSCVAERCMSLIDTCCANGGCQSQLGILDSCASTAAPSACSALATSSTTELAAIGRCIASSCSACFDGSSSSSMGIVCASIDSTLCTCSTSTDPLVVGTEVATCREGAGLTCCAQPGWPGGEDGLSQCVCGTGACDSQNVQVPSCGP